MRYRTRTPAIPGPPGKDQDQAPRCRRHPRSAPILRAARHHPRHRRSSLRHVTRRSAAGSPHGLARLPAWPRPRGHRSGPAVRHGGHHSRGSGPATTFCSRVERTRPGRSAGPRMARAQPPLPRRRQACSRARFPRDSPAAGTTRQVAAGARVRAGRRRRQPGSSPYPRPAASPCFAGGGRASGWPGAPRRPSLPARGDNGLARRRHGRVHRAGAAARREGVVHRPVPRSAPRCPRCRVICPVPGPRWQGMQARLAVPAGACARGGEPMPARLARLPGHAPGFGARALPGRPAARARAGDRACS